MRSSEFLDRGDRVLRESVDNVVGTQFRSEGQLLVVDVDRDHRGTADLRVLQREMAEPPMPNTATSCPGRAPESFTALYVVTPAQVSTAASRGSTESGTGATYAAFATAYSA